MTPTQSNSAQRFAPRPAGVHRGVRRRREPFAWFGAMLLVVLIVYLAIPGNLMEDPETRNADMSANPVSRAIKIVLMLCAIGLLLVRMATARRVLQRLNIFFIVFLGMVFASIGWSIWPPATSAKFVSILSIVCVCAAACVVSSDPRRFQKVIRPTLTFLLVASILFGLAFPHLAIEHGEGTLKDAWHGVTAQKNQFGQLSCFGLILWAHAAMSRQASLVSVVFGAAISATCLYLSRSSTSLLAAAFSVTLMFLILKTSPAMRRYMPAIVITFAVLLLAYALAILQVVPGLDVLLKPIMKITGKDMTFSNRSVIWEIIRDQVATRPWLGSGYGAYWIGPVLWSPSYVFVVKMYFYPTESHNGYLEIVNDLGFAGLLCLLGYLGSIVRQSLTVMRFDRAQGALFLCIFFAQALTNLSESVWLQINGGFVFVVMTTLVFALSRNIVQEMANRRARAAALARHRYAVWAHEQASRAIAADTAQAPPPPA